MAPVIRGNSLYTIVDGLNWQGGENYAIKLGGHLASISSSEEDIFLKENFQRGWIGLTDSASEGTWRWTDGSQVTYTNWEVGQPDNSSGIQHYAQVWTQSGKWDDAEEDTPQQSIAFNKRSIIETPFIRRGDSAYVIVSGPTWEEAEANAVKLGGHLVTVNDAAENNFLYNSFIQPKIGTPFLPEPFINGFRYWGAYWIGLSDKINEGNWQWISGENSNYSNWYGNVGGDDAHGGQDYGVFGWQWSNSWDDGGGPGGGKQEGLYGIAEIKLSTPTPTYTLTPSSASINEGATLTTSVATTDVASGTTLYYSLSGSGINSSDFSSGSLTGSGTVSGSGSFSFSHTLAIDQLTEGSESILIKLYSDSGRTLQVGATAMVSVADNATKGTITSRSVSVNEGETLIFDIKYEFPKQYPYSLYLKYSGEGIQPGDLNSYLGKIGPIIWDDKYPSNHILTTSGHVTIYSDNKTEGVEKLIIGLYHDNAYTELIAEESVSIADTSITPVIKNTGAAAFSISGKGDIGSQLSIIKTKDDPEGNGKFTYKWQSSVDGTNWTNLASTSSSYTLAATDASKQIRSTISYLDGKSNSESVDTSALSISAVATTKLTAGDFATPVNINLSLPAYIMSTNWNIDKYYYYVEQYPMTLRTAFYADYLAGRYTNQALYGQNHYLTGGQAEGRAMVDTSGILTDSNDYGAYVENYGITLLDIYRVDSRAVVNGGTMSLFAWGKEHYNNWGKAEGREISGGVEWGGIVRNNLDLYNQWQDAKIVNPTLSAFAFGYQRQNTIKSTLGVLVGSDTADKLTGQIAYGLNGNDVICSDGGRGILAGGFGDDLLVAANGGSDLAYGGPGSDIFQLNAGSTFNIRDFRKGADMIQLGSTLTSSGVTMQWDSADNSTLFYNGSSVIGKVYGKRPTEFTYSDSTNGVSKVYI